MIRCWECVLVIFSTVRKHSNWDTSYRKEVYLAPNFKARNSNSMSQALATIMHCVVVGMHESLFS